ncbi:Alpha/Beta hydrolase protein [Flagelloscypha sp. PMI_526]|nr:Alpha/Beta hydrolase protein [Flagelloscypha sp. PMI_526]
MIDHLAGRPSPGWKRTQVFLVIFFWLWRIYAGDPNAPRILWSRRVNRFLKRFTPWQIIVTCLTMVYTVRNFDKILALEAPEPLARLYSPSYYRAVWIVTGLDAGFATAMNIRPRWLRHISSIIFAMYYIIYPNEGDEKLRRFRAVPTVQMLRATWEKTTNPLIRAVTMARLPRLGVRRKILLPRPNSSTYKRPITAYLFFKGTEADLCQTTDLILDFPGGGFVAMNPEHHEERLNTWASMTGRVVLSIDYGKAPEYPYPWAINEAFDAYKVLVETVGTIIGMSGRELNIVLTGDSAGAALAVNVMIKVLELNNSTAPDKPLISLPHPLAIMLNYAALDFNFTSWMRADHLRILRSEQSSGNLPGLRELAAQKDHLKHASPLSMVGDRRLPRRKGLKRQTSWKKRIRTFTGSGTEDDSEPPKPVKRHHKVPSIQRSSTATLGRTSEASTGTIIGRSRALTNPEFADAESSSEDDDLGEDDRPISERIRYVYPQAVPNPVRIPWSKSSLELQQAELNKAVEAEDKEAGQRKAELLGMTDGVDPIGTRLTMTSRSGFFNDRIINPSMMRAMAILYIGPYQNPDFTSDYYLSPILTPDHLLAQFPPMLLQCGERDPFVDDTVIFSGRIRQAKRARKMELDLLISGKSARFGEGLRMTNSDTLPGGPADLRRERDRLAEESEEDWVQMVLFSEWSHGYLQMPTLLSEAQAVIEELADWINAVFEGDPLTADTMLGETTPTAAPPPMYSASETETDDTGITFMTKKDASRRASPYPALANKDRETFQESVAGGSSSDTASTLITSSPEPISAASPPKAAAILPPVPLDALGPLEVDYDEAYLSGGEVLSPGKRTVVPRPSGQKISEAELMRRRRLIDSHVLRETT